MSKSKSFSQISFQTLLLGLDHHRLDIQSFCLFKMTSLLMHTTPRTPASNDNTTLTLRSIDWKTRSSLPLPSSQLQQQHERERGDHFHHSDLYKLSEIISGDCDLHIRLHAIQQLNILIMKDASLSSSEGYLLSTSDPDWCLRICQLSLNTAFQFDWHTPLPTVTDPLPTEAEASLFSLQAIILLRNILLTLPSLRTHLFCSLSSSLSTSVTEINLTPIVISILKYRFINSVDQNMSGSMSDKLRIPSFDSRHSDLFHLFCSEILTIFSSSLFESSLWTQTPMKSMMSTHEIDDCCQSTPNKRRKNLQLPSFLWEDLMTWYPEQDLLYLYQKYAVPVHCSAVELKLIQSKENDWVKPSPELDSFGTPPQHDRFDT
jgi:hypothetical protein